MHCFDHSEHKDCHRTEHVLTRAVRVVRRKERDRRVPPVVDPARWADLGVELENRQHLDGRNAQILEVGNLLD